MQKQQILQTFNPIFHNHEEFHYVVLNFIFVMYCRGIRRDIRGLIHCKNEIGVAYFYFKSYVKWQEQFGE